MKTRCVHGAFWLVVFVRGMTNHVIVIVSMFFNYLLQLKNYKLNNDGKNPNMTPIIFYWL